MEGWRGGSVKEYHKNKLMDINTRIDSCAFSCYKTKHVTYEKAKKGKVKRDVRGNNGRFVLVMAAGLQRQYRDGKVFLASVS